MSRSSSASAPPFYLSIVATSRNDNHGGDMIQRMTLFVNGLLYHTKKYRFPVELILVDWNPPADRPLLKDVLPLPQADDLLTIKLVVVPAAVHNRLRHADKLPLFQMIAKNVGIRRATGQYVLCTNVDLLFSAPLFKFLAQRQLAPGKYYRCLRADVPRAIPYEKSVPELLHFCQSNVLQRLGKHKYFSPIFHTLYGILLLTVGQVFRWWREPGLGTSRQAFATKMQLIRLDTDACGDFTLMHRTDWEDIMGYAELEGYSIHIDSIALMAATALGKQQVTLPPDHCTYHVSHDDGWVLTDPVQKLFKDLDRPMLDWSTVRQLGIHLLTQRIPLQVNKPTWGFAGEDFSTFSYGNQPVVSPHE